jgi:hypothetical protein
MSTPIQHDALDPNSLQYYAPRRLRDNVNDSPSIQPLPDANELPDPQATEKWSPRYGNDSLAREFPEALGREIDDELKSRPAVLTRKRTFAVLASVAAAAGIAAAIIFPDTTKFAEWRDWLPSAKHAEMSFAERLQAANAALDRVSRKAPVPTLAVENGSGEVNAPLPLGVTVTNSTPGATVSLSGLLAGSVLSTGSESAEGQWRIALDDLPATRVIPPHDYVGPMTIVAELRGVNGQAIIRGPVEYTWRQAASDSSKAAAPTAIAAVADGNDADGTPRQIDPKEAAALFNRAEELVSNGDLPAARLLLQWLAEAHDARAAFALGATYDPIAIKQLGSIGAVADVATARTWYQKARDWGSSDASKHLEALVSMAR